MNGNTLVAQVEYRPYAGGTRVHYNPAVCPLMINGGAFLTLHELGRFFAIVPEAIACPACQNVDQDNVDTWPGTIDLEGIVS